MLNTSKKVSFALAAFLWGCSPSADLTKGPEGSALLASRTPKPTVYDFTEFDYTYARAYALRSTNLEPSPTSYVLFQPKPLEEAVTTASDGSIRALQNALDDHVARVNPSVA